jgi:hypothetical protein
VAEVPRGTAGVDEAHPETVGVRGRRGCGQRGRVQHLSGGLEGKLADEAVRLGAAHKVHHLDETGNYSGAVLVELARAHGYGTHRLSKDTLGGCGHGRVIVEERRGRRRRQRGRGARGRRSRGQRAVIGLGAA